MTDDWAPIQRTHEGIEEVDPAWLGANTDAAQIVDVRELDEFIGPLGHIEGAELLPLGILSTKLETLDASQPVVTVCHSGGRSAHAYVLLKQAGFTRVANMTGGMLRWHELGLPVSRQA